MKAANWMVTTCGGIAAAVGAISQIPGLPEKYKFPCILIATAFGAATAYFAKGKDVTGGTIQQ